jgi:NAD(P)-dependent dehydrogenase (short-subunit alcohol dehydrogenase family)
MRLKGKVILITGSTTGIGEGIARTAALEGATVVIHGTREAAAKAVVAAIEAGKGRASHVLGSLEDPETPARLVKEVLARHGRLDGLVNNAAAMTRGGIEATDAAAFDRTIAVNLRAPMLLIRAALPQFRKQGGGRVLNIGSVNGYCGERNQLAYSVSKGGLVTLTRNLADAHGAEGIRVNLLNVGWTLTPNEFALKKTEGMPEDWPTKLPKSTAPSGRLLSPQDIAWAAVFFLSDEAALINGSVVDLEQYPMIGRNPPKDL